jgi:hypothetical protein
MRVSTMTLVRGLYGGKRSDDSEAPHIREFGTKRA